MAKSIKTIQCPQCGSTQQKRIKDDHYKCESCGAEYFLDNDDINVNITHKGLNSNLKYILIGVAIIFGVIFITSIISSLFKVKKPNRTTTPITVEAPKHEKTKEYKDAISFYTLDRAGSTTMFYLAERSYEREDKEKNGYYIVFYNYLENKVIKEELILNTEGSSKRTNFEYAYMPAVDKEIILVDERKIYELDFNDLSFTDVSEILLADYPEFSSGIASVKFIYQPRGEGFVILSNMGKEFYFVPSFNKLYTKDNFYSAASSGMRNLSPSAINKTYYVFSSKSDDFPDEQIELLKIVYKYNNGGPEDKATNPRWRKQYPYSGIIYDNTPFKKIIVDKDRNRVISCDNITPDRIYFSAKVLNQQDDDKLLIAFKPTIAPDEKTQIQLLDLKTREPIWTITSEEGLGRKDAVKTDSHYILPTNSNKLLKINIKDGSTDIIELITKREYK